MRISARCLSVSVPRLPLVVGGSGQVGRHMLKALANAGCSRVRVLDLVDPRLAQTPRDFPESLGIDFKRHRLGHDSPAGLLDACEGVDCVFSMATSDVQNATRDDFMHTNVHGIKELLAASNEAGVRNFVHISSIAVTDHFKPTVDGTEEDPLPALDSYISPYDRSKREGEDAVLEANTEHLATVSLRAGGIIAGPRDFTCRSLFERPGTVVTLEGSALIDYIAAQDLCRAALLAYERLESPAVAGQAFYVSKGESIQPQVIAELIAKQLGWQLTLLPSAAQACIGFGLQISHNLKSAMGQAVPGIPPHDFLRIALTQKTFDNSRALHCLGFESQISLEEAIHTVVSEYEQQRR